MTTLVPKTQRHNQIKIEITKDTTSAHRVVEEQTTLRGARKKSTHNQHMTFKLPFSGA